MRQARVFLSTYSADVFGICSALYELGGLIVMHDASGCNSTYSTHDEPRWYSTDGMVYVSGLTETDAVLGNDERLIGDILEAGERLHPAFIAFANTPVPMMTGMDHNAVAQEIENRSGIPCFGFDTDSMNSYMSGLSKAFAAIAERIPERSVKKSGNTVNIIGATPLDFSVNGTVESIKSLLIGNGFTVISDWCMGSTLDDIRLSGMAGVNLVVSGSGIRAARAMNRIFGTPYVIGTPVGKDFSEKIISDLKTSSADGINRISFEDHIPRKNDDVYVIGESVISRSLAAALYKETGISARVIYPLENLPELEGVLTEADIIKDGEEEIISALKDAEIIIADPLYKPAAPAEARFINLGHEAYSGRIGRRFIPDLVKLSIKDFISL